MSERPGLIFCLCHPSTFRHEVAISINIICPVFQEITSQLASVQNLVRDTWMHMDGHPLGCVASARTEQVCKTQRW